MRILHTGATGVVGRRAVPLLVAAGHEVSATFRAEEDRHWAESVGAVPLRLDLFDAAAVASSVEGMDTIIHFATAIPPLRKMKKRSAWETNDRLRSAATKNLVDAALRHGTTRFIQESVTFLYASLGDQWISEDGAIKPSWDVLDSALTAEGHVARFAAGGGAGVTLRLSSLYGPGRVSAEYVAGVAARRFPIIGKGDNYVSFLHADDAASAVLGALEASTGIYNVTDDSPVPASASLDSLADALKVKNPRHIPGWVATLLLGGVSAILTNSQRVSNAHFKEATGWQPRYPSVVKGWNSVIDATATA